MRLFHATTKARAKKITVQGFLVSKADKSAKIKGVWLHSKSASPWACLHTIRKHGAKLEEVVVIEVEISRSRLTRFRSGLWFTKTDVSASAIRRVISGETFGQSASE